MRPCALCKRTNEKQKEEIAAALRKGNLSFEKLALRYSTTIAILRTHKLHVLSEEGPRAKVSLPPMPNLPAGTSPKDRAQAMCEYWEGALRLLREGEAPNNELARASAQYHTWVKTLGRWSGGVEITEAQILKSPAWARIEAHLFGALRDFPEALAAVRKRVDDTIAEGHT